MCGRLPAAGGTGGVGAGGGVGGDVPDANCASAVELSGAPGLMWHAPGAGQPKHHVRHAAAPAAEHRAQHSDAELAAACDTLPAATCILTPLSMGPLHATRAAAHASSSWAAAMCNTLYRPSAPLGPHMGLSRTHQ